MRTKRKPQSVYQYEPLITPSHWQGEERQLVVRLTQLFDQLFARKQSAVSGSVDVSGLVKSVDGVLPGDDGNVPLNAAKTVDGIAPDENGNVNLRAAFELLYPVGLVVTLSVPDNPSDLWGFGTWEPHGVGRVVVGAGTADSGAVYAAGDIGGEEMHGLTVDELPQKIGTFVALRWASNTGESGAFTYTQRHSDKTGSNGSSFGDAIYTLSGGGSKHNIMQPYIVEYRWKRVA